MFSVNNLHKRDLYDMIVLKNSDLPVRYAATPVFTPPARAMFPYPNFWHGDYRCDRPYIDRRDAGFRPRLDITPALPPIAHSTQLPNYCFNFNADRPCHQHLLGGHRRLYINESVPEWTERGTLVRSIDWVSPFVESLISDASD